MFHDTRAVVALFSGMKKKEDEKKGKEKKRTSRTLIERGHVINWRSDMGHEAILSVLFRYPILVYSLVMFGL